MPKKRSRGGGAGTVGRPPKRARTTEEPAATSETGRPQRSSAQENPPTYNFTRRQSTTTTQAPASSPPVPTAAAGARPRGRPRKSSTPMTTTTAPETSAVDASAATTTRSRGRPRKSSTPVLPTNGDTGRKRGRPARGKNASQVTPQVASAKKTQAKKAEAPVNGQENLSDEDDSEAEDTQYWLMKAEPDSRMENGVDVKFSIDDLKARQKPEAWDGVRNPVARNKMRAMKEGDLAFFYHSNCKQPGIVGIMRIVKEHSPDESAFDPNHPYYDPKSSRDKPKWDVVHVEFVRKFPQQIDLKRLRAWAKPGGTLEKMQTLVQSRLSVSQVQPKEWRFILRQVAEDDQSDSDMTIPGNGEEPSHPTALLASATDRVVNATDHRDAVDGA